MKKHRLTSAVTLAATAALALPGAALAGPIVNLGTVTVKAPKCSSKPTVVVTLVGTPVTTARIVMMYALNGPPGPGSKQYFGKQWASPAASDPLASPKGAVQTLSGSVPTGSKVTAYAVFSDDLAGGPSVTSFTVAKCPKPKPKPKPHFTG